MGGGGGGYSGDGDTAFPTPYKNSTGSGGGSVSPSSPNDTLPNFSTVTQHPTGTKYFNRGASGQPSDNGGGGGGAGAAAGINQDGGITDPASPGGAGRPFSNFPAPVIAPIPPDLLGLLLLDQLVFLQVVVQDIMLLQIFLEHLVEVVVGMILNLEYIMV